MLQRFWKPWFVYRPTGLLRRAMVGLKSRGEGFQTLSTAWGMDLLADPHRAIGHSILTTGLYELAVSEAVARLVSPGDTVIDAGANIGYMTLLAGVAAGPQGRVLSFEPHPELFKILQNNVDAARARHAMSTIELHNDALGETAGTAALVLPADFSANDGIAHVALPGETAERTVEIRVSVLDDILGSATANVMKMDVEGYEAHVLRGARRALAERRIRHIIFEDHDVAHSEVVAILRAAGYRLYSLGWTMRGLRLAAIETGSLAHSYEAPNFIATIAPDDVERRLQPRGWQVLSSRLLRRHAG